MTSNSFLYHSTALPIIVAEADKLASEGNPQGGLQVLTVALNRCEGDPSSAPYAPWWREALDQFADVHRLQADALSVEAL